jgi:hypothetical protein
MNLEERVSRLERDNRFWKRTTLLAALVPLGVLSLMGASPQETIKTLTVREIIF